MVTLAWPDVHELRACQLCEHHAASDDVLLCTHPLVRTTAAPVLCTQARRADGLCGADARHQHWPHLESLLRRPAMPVPLPSCRQVRA